LPLIIAAARGEMAQQWRFPHKIDSYKKGAPNGTP
jgi:hypothetical protein